MSTLTVADGVVHADVALTAVATDDPLALAQGAENVVVLERHDGTSEIVRGTGAGRWPTAESVLGDLLQIARATRPLPDLPRLANLHEGSVAGV